MELRSDDEEVRWFLDRYTPDAFDRAHPYAYPLSGGHAVEPPAGDCLHSRVRSAPRRRAAIRGATPRRRVPTTAYHYDDAIHGFLSMVSEPDVEPAREALSDANAALRDTFDE